MPESVRITGYFLKTTMGSGGEKFMPVVDVIFGDPGGRQHRGRALVDTGAEFVIVDKGWAAGHAVVHSLNSLSVNALGRQDVIDGVLLVGPVRHRGHLCVSDLIGSGHPFAAILGMDFIRNFSLTIDVKASIVELTLAP
ncbi:hypothetical protein [Brevundimonas sp. NIBR11]|uniref:hypothetical protein n=1 Tax=Brevundimonas sp. NIBR11 TaxID=3015999 RepID=UPI0022F11DCD|nr:hypothetical protein [Brevundimonas sp. NIBR11]WGM31507.1 hypothetical protein KKHFBJBL_01754 [Brevundimonas sp. NIBR11]